VLELDKQGALSDQRLRALADRLRSLDAEIAHGQADVQTIKNEPYGSNPTPVAAPRPVASITEVCTTCGQPIRGGATYCSGCGARQH
jgi:hypothetical protein